MDAENKIRRAGMLEAVDICEDYARAQFALPYPCAEACGLAAQVLASKIRTIADALGREPED